MAAGSDLLDGRYKYNLLKQSADSSCGNHGQQELEPGCIIATMLLLCRMSPEVTLNRIAPALSPFISSVVRNGRVGLDSTSCLRITDLKSGCTSLTPGPSCDRFKLHIPYAGETLKCGFD
ncbi:unnamed protein product [Ranitomeya imitator]|uniref:BRISC and BRCA1-A complex member 2 n=1 Tax=Ranitomeya imitator TaxID=111125 RepID=A0ABN9KXQ1_9NEOB|nr:unnamed protein product [Ranitomeya imitator]